MLYFRSIKNHTVLHLLTNYLWQYKSVSIPGVGTIFIHCQPSQVNVVDKLIVPPSYVAELQAKADVTEHQLYFLKRHLQKEKEEIVHDLRFFGDALQEKINGPGFEWQGLGFINRSTQTLPLHLGCLQPVPAAKVVRADAQHAVLVGDHQVIGSASLTGSEERVETIEKKKPVLILVGWILLLLSLLVIAFILYTGKFRVNAAGSKLAPSAYHAITIANEKA